MLEAWPLFTRNINEPWQLISISVKPTTVPQEYLRQKRRRVEYRRIRSLPKFIAWREKSTARGKLGWKFFPVKVEEPKNPRWIKGISRERAALVLYNIIKKTYLDHPWMVSWVISRPRSAISHGPSLFRYFLRFRYKGIDPYLELFILPLSGKKKLQGVKSRNKSSVEWVFLLCATLSYLHSPPFFHKRRLYLVL